MEREGLEENHKSRSCTQKVRHPSYWAASKALQKIVERDSSAEIHVYGPCEFCAGWHVGNMNNRARAEFQAAVQEWVQRFGKPTTGG